MAAQPSSAALGDPPDPPLFGSFRPSLRMPFPINVNLPSSGKMASISIPGSLSGKTAAPPSGNRLHLNAPPRSFADMVKPRAGIASQALHLFGNPKKNPGVKSFNRDGVPVVAIDNVVSSALAAPFKWTLVGKFSHGVPSIIQIRKFFYKLKMAGIITIHRLSHTHFMFIMCEELDFVRVWLGKIWHVAGFPMRVFKWTPSFDNKVESASTPVWVRLPGLPAHIFDRGVLFEIASILGKPIRADSATALRTKISEARFCVEIDLQVPRIDHFLLEIDGTSRKQRVVYENLPVFCSFCHHVGHGVEDCFKRIKGINQSLGSKVGVRSHDECQLVEQKKCVADFGLVHSLFLNMVDRFFEGDRGVPRSPRVWPIQWLRFSRVDLVGVGRGFVLAVQKLFHNLVALHSSFASSVVIEEQDLEAGVGMVNVSNAKIFVVASMSGVNLHACDDLNVSVENENVSFHVDSLVFNADIVNLDCSVVEHEVSYLVSDVIKADHCHSNGNSVIMADGVLHACENELVDDCSINFVSKEINEVPLNDFGRKVKCSLVEHDASIPSVECDVVNADNLHACEFEKKLMEDDSSNSSSEGIIVEPLNVDLGQQSVLALRGLEDVDADYLDNDGYEIAVSPDHCGNDDGIIVPVDAVALHACENFGQKGDCSLVDHDVTPEQLEDVVDVSAVQKHACDQLVVMEGLGTATFSSFVLGALKDQFDCSLVEHDISLSVENGDGNSVVEDDISVEDDGYQIAGGPELWRDDSFGPLGSGPSSAVVGSVHLGQIPLVHIPTPIFNWKSELVSQKGGPVVRRQKAIKQSIRPSWQTDALHATPLQSIPPGSGYYFSDPDEQRDYLEFKKSNHDYVETDYGSDSSVSSSYFGDEDESHAPKVSTTGKVTSSIPLICPPLRRSPRVSKKVYY